jgi:hypothetical protein
MKGAFTNSWDRRAPRVRSWKQRANSFLFMRTLSVRAGAVGERRYDALGGEFRAWVVLPELRQFWVAASRDILSALSAPPLRAVCPGCPPAQAA